MGRAVAEGLSIDGASINSYKQTFCRGISQIVSSLHGYANKRVNSSREMVRKNERVPSE